MLVAEAVELLAVAEAHREAGVDHLDAADREGSVEAVAAAASAEDPAAVDSAEAHQEGVAEVTRLGPLRVMHWRRRWAFKRWSRMESQRLRIEQFCLVDFVGNYLSNYLTIVENEQISRLAYGFTIRLRRFSSSRRYSFVQSPFAL